MPSSPDYPLAVDPDRAALWRALESYRGEHPLAQLDVFRDHLRTIDVRVVDPDFKKVPLEERHDSVENVLAAAGAAAARVNRLLLLTPAEGEERAFRPERLRDERGLFAWGRGVEVRERRVRGESVYATSTPLWVPIGGDLMPTEKFVAEVKLFHPPGIIDPDTTYGLSIDAGEMLRRQNALPVFFDSAEEARAAAFKEADRRLDQAAHQLDGVGEETTSAPSLAAA